MFLIVFFRVSYFLDWDTFQYIIKIKSIANLTVFSIM